MTDQYLPKPGEPNWQALKSNVGWHDIEILAGPFWNAEEYLRFACSGFQLSQRADLTWTISQGGPWKECLRVAPGFLSRVAISNGANFSGHGRCPQGLGLPRVLLGWFGGHGESSAQVWPPERSTGFSGFSIFVERIILKVVGFNILSALCSSFDQIQVRPTQKTKIDQSLNLKSSVFRPAESIDENVHSDRALDRRKVSEDGTLHFCHLHGLPCGSVHQFGILNLKIANLFFSSPDFFNEFHVLKLKAAKACKHLVDSVVDRGEVAHG